MIEWRFGLPPLSVRDSTANNLAEVLDLSSPNVTAPAFTVPMGPFGKNCRVPVASNLATGQSNQNLNGQLRTLALKAGFQGVR